jgi:bla regulator protein blaR1
MADLARQVLVFLAASSVQLTVFAGVAVFCLARVRTRGAGPRFVLGLVLLLPLLSLVSGWLPEGAPVKVPVPAEFLATDSTPRSGASAHAVAVEQCDETSPATSPGISGEAASSILPVAAPGVDIDWPSVIALAWLGAAVLLLLRILAAYVRLRIDVARTPGTDDPRVVALFVRCVDEAGLRRSPRLAISDLMDVPFATGLLQPVVVIPRRLLVPGAGDGLRFALLHELTHLRRRDHLFVVPELLLRTAYFFHPLMRRVLSRIGEEREHECDLRVARIVGARASYAEFLLEEFGDPRWRRGRPLLALRHGDGSAARRVRRLIEEGRPTMFGRTRTCLAAAGVAVSLLAVLAFGPAPAAQGKDEATKADILNPAFDSINALSTETAGVYHVLPVFEKVLAVQITKSGGPHDRAHSRFPDAGTEYTYDAKTARLVIRVPLNVADDHVTVRGLRAVPWMWRMKGPIEKDSVRVLLGGRAGVRGEDFEVDEAGGIVRFLKKDHCSRKKSYYIAYCLVGKDQQASIGNHHDRAAVRKFMARGSKIKPVAPTKRPFVVIKVSSVGTIAVATSDPHVFTLARSMTVTQMKVGIGHRGGQGAMLWLKPGTDYTYDEKTVRIVLRDDLEIDRELQYVYVSGVVSEHHVIRFHHALEPGTVKAVVGVYRLREGTGFQVDYPKGIVTILDPGIQAKGAQYYVKAGEGSFGNYADRDLLGRLLAD